MAQARPHALRRTAGCVSASNSLLDLTCCRPKFLHIGGVKVKVDPFSQATRQKKHQDPQVRTPKRAARSFDRARRVRLVHNSDRLEFIRTHVFKDSVGPFVKVLTFNFPNGHDDEV